MTQTIALLVDAYRELNAKKMFWITLILSGVVVCVLLFIGVSEDQTLKLIVWDTPFQLDPETDLAALLKSWYVYLGIGFWLTWAAAILALISTASIFPDFLSSGSIDLVLSKPVGRVRLFLTKYVYGLLFVALQVGVFSAASFLVIGLRSGTWEFGLLLAIPIVVVFFSYLFSICVFFGVLTRSTIASLLVTLLIWLFLFALNAADETLMLPRVSNEVYVEKLEEHIERMEESNATQEMLEPKRTELAEARESYSTWLKWHRVVVAIKTPLPKTGETVTLLERWLIAAAELPESQDQQQNFPFMTSEMYAAGVRPNEIIERADRMKRGRSATWVLGTSLAFEAFVLALTCFIFVRRDF